MRPLVKALQGRLVKIYFGFSRIYRVTSTYVGIRKKIDTWFKRMYDKLLALTQIVGLAETFPQI